MQFPDSLDSFDLHLTVPIRAAENTKKKSFTDTDVHTEFFWIIKCFQMESLLYIHLIRLVSAL